MKDTSEDPGIKFSNTDMSNDKRSEIVAENQGFCARLIRAELSGFKGESESRSRWK